MMKRFIAGARDKAALGFFLLSVLMAAFGYGVVAEHYNLFPVSLVKDARAAAQELLEDTGTRLPWYYHRGPETQQMRVHNAAAMAPGLTLVTGIDANEVTWVRVVDANGRIVHKWEIDWFKIWPKPTHLTADQVPKSNGALVHGVALAGNGDLIFNFEQLGMVRLNPCGTVVWRLPYRTHHTVQVDENGNIWALGEFLRRQGRASLPNYRPPFYDYTVLQVSSDGRVLQEISAFDLLAENNLRGLLYLSTIDNRDTSVSGDTLHLNDIDVFPSSMAEGAFAHGDLMISLRNINTVLVFNPMTRRIKFVSVGAVIRQHDPDFVDGNTISIFDNNNLAGPLKDESMPDPRGHYSRIVRISATQPGVDVRFTGTPEQPFFSDILGKHQLLDNGNTLIVEAVGGRVFEIDPDGKLLWEYLNPVGGGVFGAIADAMRLPVALDDAFFAKATSACQAASGS